MSVRLSTISAPGNVDANSSCNATSVLNEKHIEMMNLVVKSSLLVVVMIASFIIFEGFWMLCLMNANKDTTPRFIAAEHLLGIDTIINQICLMLQFGFMKNVYYLLCHKCHTLCFNCCYYRQSVPKIQPTSRSPSVANMLDVK